MTNPVVLNDMQPIVLDDIVVHDSFPSPGEVINSHDAQIDFGDMVYHDHSPEEFSVELISDEPHLSVEMPSDEYDLPEGSDLVVTHNGEPIAAIDFGDLPGAPAGTKDPEPEPEEDEIVVEEADSKKSSDEKENKKDDKWDWKSKGFGQFKIWIKDRFESVPRHTGYDTAGLERAQAYLEKLHGEVSRAMRSDIDGELDAEFIADIHNKIDEGVEKLQNRLEKVKSSKSKNKKKADDSNQYLVKEAQKVFGVQNGTVVAVPLFIATLARTLVNGSVSSGKDIEHSYKQLVKKHKLTDREKIELIQLVQDMGFPMIRDRSLLPEDGFDPESTENFDYSANYQA